MGRSPLPVGTHGAVRYYPHPHPDGHGIRATTKFRDTDGITRPVSRTGATKAAASRALTQALKERGTRASLSGSSRFRDVAPLWLDEVRRLREPTTYDTYRRNLHGRVLSAFGGLMLREIDVPAVHSWLRRLEDEGLSANAVRGLRKVLSGVLAFAVQQGAILINPVSGAGRVEGGPGEVRALTADERTDLLTKLDRDERARGDDLPDLVRFMIGTGVRVGEALALRWAQIDLDERVAMIGPTLQRITGEGLRVNEQGKTGHRGRSGGRSARVQLRPVPLPDFVVLMLQLRVPPDLAMSDPVFTNSLGGWRDPNNTQRSVRKARAAAGYPWLTTHVMRKTAITVLDEQGLTAREIAGHVGHSRPSITMDTYMDLRAKGRSAADALDGAVRQERHGS